MTPQEQRLIDDLFDRLSQQRPVTKDRQADALIQQRLRETPHAAYMLAQSAIVYQHQIAANEERIRELEEQLDGGGQSQEGGSFLGGLFGGGRETAPPPRRPVARDQTVRDAAPSPWSQQPAAQARGGGFLSTALSTAAGVAGGMMIADSLRGVFGGDTKTASAANDTSSSDQAALKDADQTQDELQDAELEGQDSGFDGGFDGGGIDI